MIKAKELRIGNWINTDGKPCRVTQLIGGVVATDDPGMWHNKDSYSPIPLNLELVQECGFELREGTLFKTGCRLYIIAGELIYDTLASKVTAIQYLHQLQNLYFALTGEELLINL